MLFSATMPSAVVALARRYMTLPTHIRAADPDDTGATVKATAQFVYRAHAMDKVEVLARILQARDRGLTIVFCQTKRTAAKVADDLDERGFAAAAIHGDLGQGAREQALRAFRNGKVDVLVATDVAARGIDVDDVTHVINYQCPEDEKTYLHRIGRTGRAGNTGIAVTFVDWDDLHALGDDRQGAGPGHPGAGGDLLQLQAPLRRAGHPGRDHRGAAKGRAPPGRARRRGGGGPRRDRSVGPRSASRSGRAARPRTTDPAATASRSGRAAPGSVCAPAAVSRSTRPPQPGPRTRPRAQRRTPLLAVAVAGAAGDGAAAAPSSRPPSER